MTEMVPPSAPVPPNKKDVTGLEFLEGISVRRVSVLSFLTFLLFLLLLFPIVNCGFWCTEDLAGRQKHKCYELIQISFLTMMMNQSINQSINTGSVHESKNRDTRSRDWY